MPAPVLPAVTKPSACPSLTRFIATRIEARFFLRMALTGCSVIPMNSSVWTTSMGSPWMFALVEVLAEHVFVPHEVRLVNGVLPEGLDDAQDLRERMVIAAHRVHGHSELLAARHSASGAPTLPS